MSSLCKLPWIACVTTALYHTYNVPDFGTPEGKTMSTPEHPLVRRTLQLKVLFCIAGVLEMIAILGEYLQPGWNGGRSLYITPVSAAGAVMAMVGGYIRHRCYVAMGPMFSPVLIIRKDHKLIKCGPYNIVRHPSYTGGLLACMGGTLWYFSRGSILSGSTWTDRIVGIVVMYMFMLTPVSIWNRVGKEDDFLRERFGAEWDEWARKVPYRLVPYIY